MKSSFVWFTALLILEAYQGTETSDRLQATYSHGVISVTIPHERGGAGHLTVEILDPEDHVVAKSERETGIGASWKEDLKLEKAISADELAWHRLRYRFVSAGGPVDGIESMSGILRTPVVHVLGQTSYFAGVPAAVRVVATDSENRAIPGRSTLRITLGSDRTLFTGPLNARGTADPQLRFPSGMGGGELHYIVDTPIGSTEVLERVRIEDQTSILLTTEKPIYQPGQTIHARALALNRASHEAAAGRNLTFEVQDSRGNKVFKKATQTDKFGVASAEFGLADEVNLGTYHLRAVMEGDDKSEIALNVERYVLPKFKVAVEFADKTKHGYRPGDHVTGTVRANYFFGKAVSGEISVKGTGIDVATFEVGSVQGRTETDGSYKFDLKLPDYFSGRGGSARVLIEATVKDSAGHAETRGEPVTVSESPLMITAVPEGGTLIPGLANQIFILASYADGKPAVAEIKLNGQTASTDENGIAVFRVNGARESIKVEAKDKEGNKASTSVKLTVRDGDDQILLRPEKAVYRAGDRMVFKIFSTKERGTVYVDAVRDGQTMLTRDLDLHNGQAELALTATPELSGTVDFNAYSFGGDARPVADHRLVFVQPADELKIDATTDRAAYKPGEEAKIRFRVTTTKGEGVAAALGIQVVDEAVFALAEKQPGFAKVFFLLEQEAMKPRYEIHSIGMPEIVEPVPTAQMERRERAAQALFAATELVSKKKFDTTAGRYPGAAVYPQFAARYQQQFAKTTPALLTAAYAHRSADLVKAAEGGPVVTDSWGTKLRIDRVTWNSRQFFVRSAGPDKKFDTADDLTMSVVVRGGDLLSQPVTQMGRSGFDVKIDHDRGPANGLARITGSVFDPTGAVLARASVTIVETSTGKQRVATTDDAGTFDLAAVPPGNYDVAISCSGFRSATQRFAIGARDSAIVSATLTVGAVTEMVEVAAVQRNFAALTMAAPMRAKAGGGGAAGGVIGGIIGGIPSALPINGREMSVFKKDLTAEPAAHVRSYFPEALYINPEIITDRNGYASITIPMADSITTWRMAMLASTAHGALGTGTSSIKVFQDFFADLDLPVTLTQGDRVSIPVAVYNYSGAAGEVGLKLKSEDWFSLVEDSSEKSLTVAPDRVGGSQFTIEARRIGKFKLTLSANMKTRADIVIREIEVVPNGRERTEVFNGRLESTVAHEVSFPASAIPDASKILVRLYPGPLSQVIEGMDAILKMPGGCFEQTSSSTYPNILALDYMKRTKKSTPEVHAKAEGYIANGYQRLLTFEVPGGGFSWFGQAPANKILTAYGLMEFFDMSKVYDVDPRVVERTQAWLASKQQADGSWKPDTNFINEGATNRFNNDVLRITAYIGWSLENTGYRGPAVEKARQYVEQNMRGNADAYTLAVIANFAADDPRKGEFLHRAISQLVEARTEDSWNAQETGVYGGGASAAIETTGLAVQALLKSGESSSVAQKALAFIASKKDATGAWGSTQATIMALRAVLLSTEKGAADVRGTVEVLINGAAAETLVLTPENNDLLHQFALKNVGAKNAVEIRFRGTGGLAYQIAGQYFVPWTEEPKNEPLSIAVDYDRARLAQDDIATATAVVRNNLKKTANMVMVDLGIPPGFDLLSEDLQDFKEKTVGHRSGRLEKFSLTATQAILYFDSIGAGETVKVKFRLRAKFPIRARTFQSRVYEYYDPEVSGVARPVQLEVRKK